MGGGGTPDLEITLISPESPISNYAGESRTFKASVNLNCNVLRWKLDGVVVQTNNYPTANTDYTYIDDAVFGSHELKVEAEKDGVVVSKSWIWNVDEIAGTGQSSPDTNSATENASIEIDNSILYHKFDGTYYIEIHWSSLVCEGYRAQNHTIVTSCDQSLQFVITWQVITYPEDPEPAHFEREIEVHNYCNGEGIEVIDLPSHFMDSSTSVRINLTAECHALIYWIPTTLSGSAYVTCGID
ncbi:hypothetical protein [Methanococcoides burtonii]|uniref:Uncharacterized protein n=1 Tax=Methanococcoides burtonii (strain DSM 6242 / NBRC 107633 / OCM 468 / ACE-M) TaxID=259564 RepID=Q12WU7_METBU|nr:hypothetical protein [Methanococcoides burtonii]ABE52079.1 Hypothetical protein Mbur_1156 [Methanococcoides burtonii DSM 6242]